MTITLLDSTFFFFWGGGGGGGGDSLTVSWEKAYTFFTAVWILLQVDQLFSDLKLLEADLMATMNDHIRLVNFGYGGNPETIYPHLR